MPWQCPHCGKWNRWRYRTCNICGTGRPHSTYHHHHRSNKNGIIILLGVIIVLLLAYIAYNLSGNNMQSANSHSLATGNTTTISTSNTSQLQHNTLSNNANQQPSALQNLSVCYSQVNGAISILNAKLPGGSQVNIVNTSIFSSPAGLSKYNEINSWIVSWSYTTRNNGMGEDVFGSSNCNRTVDISSYMCQDFRNESMPSYGVVVKVDANYGPSTTNIAFTYPLLCNTNGNLLPNSKSWIEIAAANPLATT